MTAPLTDIKRGQLVDALLAMRDLFAEEGTWTQGVLARRADGRRAVDPQNPDAVSWCVHGAVERFDSADIRNVLRAVLRAVLGNRRLADWNDAPGRTRADVLDLIDTALHDLKNPDGDTIEGIDGQGAA